MNTTLRTVFAIAILTTGSGVLAQGAVPAPIASQETNWSGVTADVTEFKRKGNTLTAKVKLRNAGPEPAPVIVMYEAAYVLEADAAKKYEVLKDDQGAYIAANTSTHTDQFRDSIPAGGAKTLWMKFPAPPATTKVATLQIEETPPFEDLPIQDQ